MNGESTYSVGIYTEPLVSSLIGLLRQDDN